MKAEEGEDFIVFYSKDGVEPPEAIEWRKKKQEEERTRKSGQAVKNDGGTQIIISVI